MFELDNELWLSTGKQWVVIWTPDTYKCSVTKLLGFREGSLIIGAGGNVKCGLFWNSDPLPHSMGTQWTMFAKWSRKTRNKELIQICVLLLIINTNDMILNYLILCCCPSISLAIGIIIIKIATCFEKYF